MEVWLLTINGQDGIFPEVHPSQLDAEESLFEYVRARWEANVLEEMPSEPVEAVQYFFEVLDTLEWYELAAKELPDPPPGDDEVDLTEKEVEIIIAALDYADHYDVAVEVGLERDRTRDIMTALRERLRA